MWKERITNTKSPRERRFEVQQVWVNVAVTALVLAIVTPVVQYHLHHRSAGNMLAGDMMVAVGFYGLAVFTVWHSFSWLCRKRRIQVEDGTFVAEEWAPPTLPGTANPFDKGPLQRIRWITHVCVLIYATQMASKGHWGGAAALVAMGIAFPLLTRQAQKRRSRFVSVQSLVFSLTALLVVVALGTLVLFNSDLAKGLLGFPALSAAVFGFNAAVIAGYVLLWVFLQRRRRSFEALPLQQP